MGFGLLFSGYFITELMSFHSFGYLTRLVGFIIMAIAAKKLAAYERTFSFVGIAACVMTAISLLGTASGISGILYNNFIIDAPLFSSTAQMIYNHTENVLDLIFNLLLLWAIRKISLATDIEKNAYAAARNSVFLIIYYAMYYIAFLPFEFAADYVRYFSAPVMLLYIVCLILNSILIYSSYAKICDEGDVDMPRKPSRFEFINKIREESDRRESRAIESTKEYIEKKKEKKRR